MKRDTFYWWLKMIGVHLSAFNLGYALHSVTVGVALSLFMGSLAVWAEATFKPKPEAPASEASLCNCDTCRLIRAWELYSK